MKPNWINGATKPTVTGEYFVIIEAQDNMGEFKKGDVEVTTDVFYTDDNKFYEASNEIYWKVLYWADMSDVEVPDNIRDRVVSRFGNFVNIK